MGKNGEVYYDIDNLSLLRRKNGGITMKEPIIWAVAMLVAFLALFLTGTLQLQGLESVIIQMIGFSGMVFAILYSVLLTQKSNDEKDQAFKR
jgi:hypothetical protein